MKYPIKKRFKVNDIEYYIDSNCGMGRNATYSLYCVTTQKSICTRARYETIERKIKEKAQ